MKAYEEKMIREMELRNYTEASRRVYLHIAARLCEYFGRDPEEISSEKIKDYILYLQKEKKLASSTIHGYIYCFRFLINDALKRNHDRFDFPRRKREHRLPIVLSKEELKKLFAACWSVKIRTIFMTAYSAGLRVSEICNLKVGDIDSKRMVLHIRLGKGRKDRYTILTSGLLHQLRVYYLKYRPTSYLFYGKTKDIPLVSCVPSKRLKLVMMRAGIPKISGHGLHMFRHSFATHMLEAGVDLRTIQVLLGHRSITTTTKYLKITDKKLETAHLAVDLLKSC